MTQYNKQVNSQLFDLLESVDETVLSGNNGSYFDSILGLLNHILLSDLGWLSTYRLSNLKPKTLQTAILDYENPGFGKILYHNLSDLRDHREKVDDLFIDFVEEMSDDQFQGEVKLTRSNGKTHTFPFGKVLMHLFNHQTHHRGAVSQILDRAGVENDYSNLMRLLM